LWLNAMFREEHEKEAATISNIARSSKDHYIGTEAEVNTYV